VGPIAWVTRKLTTDTEAGHPIFNSRQPKSHALRRAPSRPETSPGVWGPRPRHLAPRHQYLLPRAVARSPPSQADLRDQGSLSSWALALLFSIPGLALDAYVAPTGALDHHRGRRATDREARALMLEIERERDREGREGWSRCWLTWASTHRVPRTR
jgi:hypothetical protein